MAFKLPPPPVRNNPADPAFRDWFYKVQQAFSTIGSILFTSLDFTGSNLTSIQTRNHNDLQSIQGGASNDYYHLTNSQATDLTDGGDSTLHFHSSDRNLANATGVLDETNGGTGQSTYTTGDILYASSSNTLSKLPIGSSGQGLLVSGGLPSWQDITTQVKVYEPVVISGFNDNVAYAEAEPKVPNFVTDSNGDIVMAWGGNYADT